MPLLLLGLVLGCRTATIQIHEKYNRLVQELVTQIQLEPFALESGVCTARFDELVQAQLEVLAPLDPAQLDVAALEQTACLGLEALEARAAEAEEPFPQIPCD